MKRLLLLFLIISKLSAMELIERKAVSSKNEAVKLYTNQRDLYVEDENAAYRVKKHNIDPLLNEVIKRQALNEFKKEAGYVRISQLDDGEYTLTAKVRGDGGFLLTGVIVYQTCRVVGYVGLAAGSTSAIVAGCVAGGPAGGFAAASAAIAAAPVAAAKIETGSLFLGTAASWIPWLP